MHDETSDSRLRCAIGAGGHLLCSCLWRVLRKSHGTGTRFNASFVQIGWQVRKMAVPLSQLEAMNPDESTQEGIGDWHDSVSLGYCL